MEPVPGRFHSLRDESGALFFVRVTSGSALELLAGDVAFRANLFDSERPARIRGRKQPPSLHLLALLFAAPSTTGTLLLKNGEVVNFQTDDTRKDIQLQLRCKDRSGVELVVTVPMRSTPARRILEEMHESLFSAIVALEATVRDAGGEKHSDFLDEKQADSPTLDKIKNAQLPLSIRGQTVESQAVFRRAAAVDSRIQGNRAFVIAGAAARVRTELLEQRKIRKEAEMLKKKREREMLLMAKRKHEMMKAAKGKPVPSIKKRKKSLFASSEDGSENILSGPASAVTVPRPRTAGKNDTIHQKEKWEEDSTARQSEIVTEQRMKEGTMETRNPMVKEQDVPLDQVEPAPTLARPPPVKKKKRKKVRTLV